MDYGISLAIPCLVCSRAACSLQPKHDSVWDMCPPVVCCLLAAIFVPQLTASCQDVWGCHVNMQLCMLTPHASHVQVCTVK